MISDHELILIFEKIRDHAERCRIYLLHRDRAKKWEYIESRIMLIGLIKVLKDE